MLSSKDSALIVVDMQNDFCSLGGGMDKRGYDISHSRKIIPHIARMIKVCRERGVRVYFVRGENSPLTTSPTWENRPSAQHDKSLGFRLITPGSWGAQIVEDLRPLPQEAVVVKTRYSAFINTELPLMLRAAGMQNLIFAGATTNACIDTSVRDAFVMDFNVIVAADCVASPEPELGEASLKSIAKYFGRVEDSAVLLKELEAANPLVGTE